MKKMATMARIHTNILISCWMCKKLSSCNLAIFFQKIDWLPKVQQISYVCNRKQRRKGETYLFISKNICNQKWINIYSSFKKKYSKTKKTRHFKNLCCMLDKSQLLIQSIRYIQYSSFGSRIYFYIEIRPKIYLKVRNLFLRRSLMEIYVAISSMEQYS